MLARAARRARDVAIRISLGATTGRLIRQCLTESVVLARSAAPPGCWPVHGRASSGAPGPRHVRPAAAVFALDARVAGLHGRVSRSLTAVLFGLAPALRASGPAARRRSLRPSGKRSATRDERHASARRRAARLVGRRRVRRRAAGANLDQLHADGSGIRGRSSRDRAVRPRHRRLLTRSDVGARPASCRRGDGGARRVAASVSTCGLVANCSYTGGFRIEGGGEGISLPQNWVGPQVLCRDRRPDRQRPRIRRSGYGTKPARGNRDRVHRATLSRDRIPSASALESIQLDTEIVGVVPDARWLTLREPPRSMVFFPIDQPPAFRAYPINMDVRVAGDAASAALAVRNALRACRARAHRRQRRYDVLASRGRRQPGTDRGVPDDRLCGLALLLASVGLYGVLSYAVVQRTREIGVRMALGARRSEVAGLVVRDALRVVVGGLLAGGVAAAVTGRMLKTLLLDVSASDPAAYALALVVLVVATLAAAYLPARRAARVDPMLALRTDVQGVHQVLVSRGLEALSVRSRCTTPARVAEVLRTRNRHRGERDERDQARAEQDRVRTSSGPPPIP